jgi:hypothetical protein
MILHLNGIEIEIPVDGVKVEVSSDGKKVTITPPPAKEVETIRVVEVEKIVEQIRVVEAPAPYQPQITTTPWYPQPSPWDPKPFVNPWDSGTTTITPNTTPTVTWTVTGNDPNLSGFTGNSNVTLTGNSPGTLKAAGQNWVLGTSGYPLFGNKPDDDVSGCLAPIS